MSTPSAQVCFCFLACGKNMSVLSTVASQHLTQGCSPAASMGWTCFGWINLFEVTRPRPVVCLSPAVAFALQLHHQCHGIPAAPLLLHEHASPYSSQMDDGDAAGLHQCSLQESSVVRIHLRMPPSLQQLCWTAPSAWATLRQLYQRCSHQCAERASPPLQM